MSALGFTGLGNGNDSTLAIAVNDDRTTTYLKSFDANAKGERFEVSFGGLSQPVTRDVNGLPAHIIAALHRWVNATCDDVTQGLTDR
jgi:hypothetical protein